ncbi:hypothetical protein J41TS4_13140 [Paenibacillus apis]|uniref:Uncharacterized protein n=2 Tax=Paenibacillus apis TaxID=1792174 RepID=A0A919XYB1_9BACL|nr:hypothetical protein J41TS4_13140 [Paenibacillus apis]
MGRGRILKLSLGLSQVQFRYWLEYYGYNKSFLQFVRLFENQKSNYYIVEWYINQNNFRDLLDLSKIYTGKKNMYYVKKLVEALEIIKITRSDNMSFLQGLSNKNIIDNWDTLISHSLKKADNIIIEKIEKGQDQLIKSRKELGATSWFVIECFELPENYFAVMLEEGHVINYVLLKYDQTNDEFFSIYESNINENDG